MLISANIRLSAETITSKLFEWTKWHLIPDRNRTHFHYSIVVMNYTQNHESIFRKYTAQHIKALLQSVCHQINVYRTVDVANLTCI